MPIIGSAMSVRAFGGIGASSGLYSLGDSAGVEFAVDSSVGYNHTTYSWTVPAGVTSVSMVVIASGASGGAGSGGLYRGSGGGGGGVSYRNGVSVTPGEVLTISVGRGAPGALVPSDPPNQTANGNNGLYARVERGSTILVTANGGSLGYGSNYNTIGAGGTGGSTLNANYGGGTGGNGGTGGSSNGGGGDAGLYTGGTASLGNGVGGDGRDVFGGTVGPPTWIDGEDYGGGSAGSNQQSGNGGDGRVRIIWDNSNTRSFPSTRTARSFSTNGEWIYTGGQSGPGDGSYQSPTTSYTAGEGLYNFTHGQWRNATDSSTSNPQIWMRANNTDNSTDAVAVRNALDQQQVGDIIEILDTSSGNPTPIAGKTFTITGGISKVVSGSYDNWYWDVGTEGLTNSQYFYRFTVYA